MKDKSTIWFFLVLVFIIPVIGYVGLEWYQRSFERLPVMGPQITKESGKVDHHIDSFLLTNQDGNTVSINDWNDKIVIADFFFTYCPSICPAMTQNLRRVQQYFKDDPAILINSFSVDPERDSASRLKNYERMMSIDGSNWHLLTGDKKQIYKLARNSFMIVATDGDGGPGDFIHSEKLVLIDKQRRIRGYYDGTSEKETDQLIHNIKKLKNEN